MNTYKGLRSTDAEIVLDLVKGKALFDYSLNSFASPLNSNTSCVLSKHRTKKQILDVLKDELIYACVGLFSVIVVIGGLIMPFICKNEQYNWQRFLKWFYLIRYGMEIQTNIGYLHESRLIFNIKNNIWFDYELSGDYNNKIKQISLKRHFTLVFHKNITYHIQRGWDVIFDFKEPPKDGNCILRSTL